MVRSGKIGAGSKDSSAKEAGGPGIIPNADSPPDNAANAVVGPDSGPNESPPAAVAGRGLSSKAILAIVLVAVALTAVAVYWYALPSGAAAAITSPEQAANTSVDVARTAADLSSSLDGIQEKLSPS